MEVELGAGEEAAEAAVDVDEEYPVEAILGERHTPTRKRGLEYEVKWAGRNEKDNT